MEGIKASAGILPSRWRVHEQQLCRAPDTYAPGIKQCFTTLWAHVQQALSLQALLDHLAEAWAVGSQAASSAPQQ